MAESKFRNFLTKYAALFGAVSLVLTAIGLVITWNSHVPAVQRIPTLIIDPVRTTIIDSKFFPNSFLKVTNPDNVLVQSDVTALHVYFWNDGKQPIKPSDVLQPPLRIVLDDTSGKILDYKVLKVSRPDVIKIGLKPNQENSPRELILDFNILEEGDGFSCQLLYAGNPSSTVNLLGGIEGARTIDNNEIVSNKRIRSEMYFLVPIFMIVFVIMSFIVWNAVKLAFRIAVWRQAIINDVDQSAAPKRNVFTKYVARFIPHLSVIVLMAAITLVVLVLIKREFAHVNIMESVPKSIRP